MVNIIFGILLFINVLAYFVFFDVILSWLLIFGIKFRPKFLGDILDPLYNLIKKNLPVHVGPFDLTAFILMLGLIFLGELIIVLYPDVHLLLNI